MEHWLFIVLGAIISTLAGYVYGLLNMRKAVKLSKRLPLMPHEDSIEQAKKIASAIRNRAICLKNSKLAYLIGTKNIFYVFDDYTKGFLKGDCVKLVRFIRICHLYGINIKLYQIGQKINIGNNECVFYSQPDIELYIKQKEENL